MSYYTTVLVALFLLAVITRALPFFIGKYMSPRINQLGKLLPAYIMLLLVIYEMNIIKIIVPPHDWPAFAALFILTVIHLWRRNTLLSLFIGTLSYLLFLSLIS